MTTGPGLAKVLTLVQPDDDRPPRAVALGFRRTIAIVLDLVADYTGTSVDEIRGTSRKSEITHARQLAYYCCRQITGAATTTLGRSLGVDHTSVLKSCKRVDEDMAHPVRAQARVIITSFEAGQ